MAASPPPAAIATDARTKLDVRAAIAPELRGERWEANTKEWNAARSEALPSAERSLQDRRQRAETTREQLRENRREERGHDTERHAARHILSLGLG